MAQFFRHAGTAAAVLVCSLLAGCETDKTNAALSDSWNSMTDKVNSAFQKTSSTSTGGTGAEDGATIEQTPLAHLFRDHPFDTKAGFNHSYPRVAITIVKAPANASADWSAAMHFKSANPPSGCFELSAVLWESPTKSTAIPAFKSCFPDQDMQKYTGVALKGADDWIGQAGFYINVDETSGNRRTDGPVPPDSVVPSGPKYQAFYGLTGFSTRTLTGGMFAHLLLQMDFDWSLPRDRRVWISHIVLVE